MEPNQNSNTPKPIDNTQPTSPPPPSPQPPLNPQPGTIPPEAAPLTPVFNPSPVANSPANPAPIAPSPPTPTQSPQPPQASQPAPEPSSNGIVVGSDNVLLSEGVNPPVAASAMPGPQPKSRRPKLSKKVLIPLIAVFLLGGSASAFYFGYYTNPSVIYSQALKNTGKGYDKLVEYADKQASEKNKGYIGTGSYKIESEGFSTDGKMSFKSDDKNSQTTFDVGLGVSRVSADIRTFKSASTNPDIYVKASGIKGLGSLIEVPELDPQIDPLDNTWIVIDHTLIDNLTAAAGQEDAVQPPTQDQVMDEAKAFGKVNQEYLFSTDKDKAVTKVVKEYGKETINGHNTYHYKVAFQKENVKAYLKAQETALKASKLQAWIKANDFEKDVTDSFAEMQKGADEIKDSHTFDLWADINQRVIYKIRPNTDGTTATNYIDFGLDYKGGSKYPFFIAGQADEDGTDATFSFVATLDSKTSDIDMKLNVNVLGAEPTKVTADFKTTPNNSNLKIDKPANAKTLAEVLSALGLSESLDELLMGSSSVSVKAEDSERQSDIKALQTQLEAHYSNTGKYPSLAEINSPSWRAANMPSLDTEALKDPAGTVSQLVGQPAANIYAYQPSADGLQFTLTATLSDGKPFAKVNLN